MRVPVSGPVLLALVIGFLGIQPRLAQAQDGEVETRERSALAACDSGKTQEGIAAR